MGNRARIRRDAMSLNPIDDALFQKDGGGYGILSGNIAGYFE